MRNDLLEAAQQPKPAIWGNLFITIPVMVVFGLILTFGGPV